MKRAVLRAMPLYLIPVFLTSVAYGNCPSWITKDRSQLPLCNGKSGIPETYPTSAVIVSDGFDGARSPKFTASFVAKVMKASPINRKPLLILPVGDETFELVKSTINNSAVSESEKKEWIDQIRRVPAASYLWQQDYYHTTVDPKTGTPVLREVTNYGRKDQVFDSFNQILESTKDCGFEEGLGVAAPKAYAGTFGGNRVILPGGICALGNDHFPDEKSWSEFADQICGTDPALRMKVPTARYWAGHADEVVKVIPNKKAKAPCDFAISVASPKKALDLLSENESNPFFSLTDDAKYGKTFGKPGRSFFEFYTLCQKLKDQKTPKLNPMPGNSKSGSGVSFFNYLLKRLENFALAQEKSSKIADCENATNKDVLNLLKSDSVFRDLQDSIQKEVDEFKIEMVQKIKMQLPNCKVEVVDIPELYSESTWGFPPAGSKSKGAFAATLLPNTVNAVSIDGTVITPEPMNDTFKKYINQQYQRLGIKSEFVDTFSALNWNDGNLHCATHSIPICNPGK